MLTVMTSGESHGQYMTAIIEGLPSGLLLDEKKINNELARRQGGYGRGGRMKIETDQARIIGGVVRGKTNGAPLSLMIENADFKIDTMPQLDRPRPGHADLAGALKYDMGIREVLERASARETALRVAAGSVCKQVLNEFGIDIASHVTLMGDLGITGSTLSAQKIKALTGRSVLGCIDPALEKKMIALIDVAAKKGDTIGGEIEVVASGVPIGLGSFAHHSRKLDAQIAAGIMSIQAIKAVQFGLGFGYACVFGSQAHDEIAYTKKRSYYHKTNNAGGIEGGMSNGEDIVVRATMKPIATLKKPLRSVDMKTKKSQSASFERSDVCAVTACGVVCEAVLAEKLADAFLAKFGGDSLREIMRNYKGYLKQIG